ncbi:hypothetical protein GCM10023347_35190 [Streptomyces chumphonensis]|uniref:Uncharacterized protein n=1 Tax=Streptomyces chumphonensis TaxID=1214925 RepID=A0A927EXR9_9ACTN|nr:hypothetical protein [Streptomyces chumphonensis]MBD3930942.1 hypothetical protein [Streptomyces chumphonensis]
MFAEIPTLLLSLTGAGGVAAAYGWHRRRVGRTAPGERAEFRVPLAVVPSVEREALERLRRQAHDEILALSRVIKEFGLSLPPSPLDARDTDGAAADQPDGPGGADCPHEGLQRALDAYAAAAAVLDAARGRVDVAGVLVLIAEGQDGLTAARNAAEGRRASTRPRVPVCFFHPLHGQALRHVEWRAVGSARTLEVRACLQCAWDVRYHRPPEVLTDECDGRLVPYFQVPGDRSLWAATGFGSLVEGRLADRVLRGDFTRARAAALEHERSREGSGR